jgi:Na+/melibiose symporter-like transporter
VVEEEADEQPILNNPSKRDGMSNKHVNAYVVGHLQNDLCASMWFIYLTYYLQTVVGLSPQISASA